MASGAVRAKLILKCLKRNHPLEQAQLQWMDDLKGWIQTQCPYVQMYTVKASSLAWLVVMPGGEKLEKIGHPDVRILIDTKKKVKFEVLGKTVQEFEMENADSAEKLMEIIKTFHPEADYIVCNGKDEERTKCKYWIKRKAHRLDTKVENLNVCEGCLIVGYRQARNAVRLAKVTSPQKRAREEPDSRCNYRFLSPKSAALRRVKSRREKAYLKSKLQKTVKILEATLTNNNNEELKTTDGITETKHSQGIAYNHDEELENTDNIMEPKYSHSIDDNHDEELDNSMEPKYSHSLDDNQDKEVEHADTIETKYSQHIEKVHEEMQRWVGRVALVTGASSGIGLELAERLAQHGMKVVGCARNTQKIQELADRVSADGQVPGSVLPVVCDVAKEEQVLAMFAKVKDEYGGVDVCVNNAGVSHKAPLVSGATEHFRNMLDVNVFGLTICTREAIQSMQAKGVDDGHIINLNSGVGHTVPPGYDATFYAATKHAVTALTEGLRQELRKMKSHIRVSAVSPGLVKTEFAVRMRGDEGTQMYETQPVLYAKDIVDAIIYQLAAPPHVQVHDQIIMPNVK